MTNPHPGLTLEFLTSYIHYPVLGTTIPRCWFYRARFYRCRPPGQDFQEEPLYLPDLYGQVAPRLVKKLKIHTAKSGRSGSSQGLIKKKKKNEQPLKNPTNPHTKRAQTQHLTWWGSSWECIWAVECPSPNNFAPSKLIQVSHSFSRYSRTGSISKGSPGLFCKLFWSHCFSF